MLGIEVGFGISGVEARRPLIFSFILSVSIQPTKTLKSQRLWNIHSRPSFSATIRDKLLIGIFSEKVFSD